MPSPVEFSFIFYFRRLSNILAGSLTSKQDVGIILQLTIWHYFRMGFAGKMIVLITVRIYFCRLWKYQLKLGTGPAFCEKARPWQNLTSPGIQARLANIYKALPQLASSVHWELIRDRQLPAAFAHRC